MTVAVSLNVFPAAACIALTLMVMLGCTALVTFPSIYGHGSIAVR